MDEFYEHYVHHKNELKDYGFKLSEEEYSKLEQEWYNYYSKENKIGEYCKYVLEYYKNNIDRIGRDKNFEY
jgi:hypothetical protein